MVRRLFLVLAVAMLALPASAMADRYAAPGGSGEVAGCTDQSSPCSLEKALSTAARTRPSGSPKAPTNRWAS
jgi:hypothetical protein